jgi:hypothetical protein
MFCRPHLPLPRTELSAARGCHGRALMLPLRLPAIDDAAHPAPGSNKRIIVSGASTVLRAACPRRGGGAMVPRLNRRSIDAREGSRFLPSAEASVPE